MRVLTRLTVTHILYAERCVTVRTLLLTRSTHQLRCPWYLALRTLRRGRHLWAQCMGC